MNPYISVIIFAIIVIIALIMSTIESFKNPNFVNIFCTFLIFLFFILSIINLVLFPCDSKYINVEYSINKNEIENIVINKSEVILKLKDISSINKNIFYEKYINYEDSITKEVNTNKNEYKIIGKIKIYLNIFDIFKGKTFSDIEKEKIDFKDINYLKNIIIYEASE